jgi:hypothetical protein
VLLLKGYEYERLKNIGGISLRSESYFNSTVSVDSKGVEKRTYATGVVMTVQEDGL